MVKRKAAAKKPAAKKKPSIADRKVKNGAPRSMAAAKKAAKKPARTSKPRSGEQLELIKGVRYADLDRICKQIGDNMDEIAGLRAHDSTFRQSGLRAMRVHAVTGYNYAGVTLTRNQGDETLTVKRDKKGTASEGGGALNQPAEPADPDSQGTGQEPGAIADSLTAGDDEEPEN